MSDDEALQRARRLTAAASEAKAEEMVLLEVSELTTLAHYFLICSGNSNRHVTAIADRIVRDCREDGFRPINREGEAAGRWALLDYGDVIVHVFDPETRDFYRLTELWADAPRVDLEVPA